MARFLAKNPAPKNLTFGLHQSHDWREVMQETGSSLEDSVILTNEVQCRQCYYYKIDPEALDLCKEKRNLKKGK